MIEKLAALPTVLLTCAALAAEPAPEPPATAQAAYQVEHPEGLRARLLRDEASPVRSHDPAIFTELSPVTASDPAVRLPEDQQSGFAADQAAH